MVMDESTKLVFCLPHVKGTTITHHEVDYFLSITGDLIPRVKGLTIWKNKRCPVCHTQEFITVATFMCTHITNCIPLGRVFCKVTMS